MLISTQKRFSILAFFIVVLFGNNINLNGQCNLTVTDFQNPTSCYSSDGFFTATAFNGVCGRSIRIYRNTAPGGVDQYLPPAAQNIIITAGTQESLSLIAAHFLDENSCAVYESPGYNGFRHLLARHRAQGIPVPVDQHGLCSDQLPDQTVQLAFVTPSHQYPLGHTLSVARRLELLAWASSSGALIIEDDYDGDFCYGPALPAPLKAMSPGQVIYLGSFSKTLGPGLRLGYMVCPPKLSQDFIARKALLNNGSPWLTQAVLARFFDEYDYSRHLQYLRRRYLEQRNTLLQGLKKVWGNTGTISGQNAGMHLAFRLPQHSPDANRVAARALQCGIRLYPLAQAASQEADSTDVRYLLFGYANLESRELQQAMQHLALIQPNYD